MADLPGLRWESWYQLACKARLAQEVSAWPREGISAQTLGSVLWNCGGVQLAEGQRARAEDLWRQMEELANRTHVVSTSLHMARRDILLAVAEGHLEDAVTLARRFMKRADESGVSGMGRMFGVLMLLDPLLYLGREDAWLETLDESPIRLVYPTVAAARAVCLARLGRTNEGWKAVGPLLDGLIGSSNEDEMQPVSLVMLLEAAVTFGHGGAAQALTRRLAPVAHLSTLWAGFGVARTTARHLGDASKLSGDWTAAGAYYAQALEAASKIRFRPELALAHLSTAELLLEGGDGSGALEHLDFAIPELQEMCMRPALERALILREAAGERPAPKAAPPVVSDNLTPREREVAGLLAVGRSNREIAEALVITEGTAEVHVKRILNKLGLKSRAQVAAWAAEHAHATDKVD
jgi:DNA-binding CsgD family transcriptional regulator